MQTRIVRLLKSIGLLNISFRLYEFLRSINPRYILENLITYRNQSPGEPPIPPVHFIVLVSGVSKVSTFLQEGMLAYQGIQKSLKRNRIDSANFDTILDFGCGCGRVLRNWGDQVQDSLFGTDYNPRLAAWCENNLPDVNVGTNNLAPPLAYSAQQFELIYALSVFSHISEQLQLEWMREFHRVLGSGGFLYLSLRGDYYADKLSESELSIYNAGQVVVRFDEASGTNLCNTYHPQEFVREVLADGFELMEFVAQGAKGNPYQDSYLFRKV